MEIGYQSTYYHFFSISDRNPKGSVIASVSAPTGYVHSFSLTPKYIILVSLSFTFCYMLTKLNYCAYV